MFFSVTILILVASALASINTSAEGSSVEDTLTSLQNDCVEVGEIDLTCAQRYHDALANARKNKGEEVTRDEIRAVVEEVNEQVRVERLGKCPDMGRCGSVALGQSVRGGAETFGPFACTCVSLILAP